MVGWEDWIGKKIYIELNNGTHPYSGKVIDIDNSINSIIFIKIIDKYGKTVQFVTSEIKLIKEEE